MSKEVITSANAPKAIGPYSSAISLQSLSNLKALVENARFPLADVVKTTVFLADIGDFTAVNEVYSTYFAQPYPTRSCVAVKDLPKGARVEIECICCRS